MAKKNKVRQRRHGETIRKERPSKQQRQNSDTSSSCLVNFVFACLVIIGVVVAALGYAYATSPIRSVVIETHDAAGMKMNKKYNTDLQKGQKLFPELIGAESIAVDEQQNWYTGLADGRLIKIADAGKSTETVHDITRDVEYTANGGRSKKRPLGMRIFQNKLYFADSYQGLFSMNLETLSWKKIIGFNEVTPPLKFANDLTISQDGEIYFIDASDRWTYEHTPYLVAEGRCNGRLFKIDKDGENVQLLKENLCMPNGVELTYDETQLLVSEYGRRRILVINVKTLATMKTILLHGGADNIRRSPSGGYWLPMPSVVDPVEQFANRYPAIRDIAMKLLGSDYLATMIDIRQGTIVKLNDDLEIERIHQDLEGKVAWAITHALEYKPGKFLLGSFSAPGIVQLDLSPTYEKIN